MFKKILAIVLLFTLIACEKHDPSNAHKRIVVTTKFLHALVTNIIEGTDVELTLLVDRPISPHDFHLRPSQLSILQQADKLIYVDDKTFELFLSNHTPHLEKKVLVPILKHLPNALTQRTLNFETTPHNTHIDPHFWLSPTHTIATILLLRKELSHWQPNLKHQFHQNSANLIERIQQNAQQHADILEAVKDRSYVAYHDAYQYLEYSYELKGLAAIASTPEAPLTMKHIVNLKKRMTKHDIRCILSDIEVEPDKVRTLLPDRNIKIITLDPAGTQLTPGKDLYFDLINHIVTQTYQCLKDE